MNNHLKTSIFTWKHRFELANFLSTWKHLDHRDVSKVSQIFPNVFRLAVMFPLETFQAKSELGNKNIYLETSVLVLKLIINLETSG